jgi:hypothetical protein
MPCADDSAVKLHICSLWLSLVAVQRPRKAMRELIKVSTYMDLQTALKRSPALLHDAHSYPV